MRPWMIGLGVLWVGALALSASVLQLTRTVPRQEAHHATITQGVTPPQAVSKKGSAHSLAPPQAASRAAVSSEHAKLPGTVKDHAPARSTGLIEDGTVPTDSTSQPEAPSIFSAWEPITQQIFAPKQPLTQQDTQTIKTAIKPVSATERVVDRQAVWGTLKENPFQVMREAVTRPAFVAGQLTGVELASVPEDGVLHQSGFQSGDVIRSINGQAVTNPAVLVTLPMTLQQAGIIKVQVERNGHPVTLTYRMQ